NKKEGIKGRISNIMHYHPPEFLIKDALQVIIGSSILAIPIGFTEETWELGGSLPILNILGLFLISMLFISSFTYYNYHKRHGLKKHFGEFVKRIFATYLVSFLVVSVLLLLIQRAPWTTDWLLALKRTVIVTFPSSMSGTIADTIK
ncbi:DUF2391 family protein, partial [Candidatus Woesearchaeota archaeon]|nr:DUF2391 family protein [Candidatus Woesearchaeota archaeon]